MSLTESAQTALPLLQAIESTLTSLAFVVGGVWAVGQYQQRREALPKARLTQHATTLVLDATQRLLRVELTIENCGATVLTLDRGLLRVKQLAPLVGALPGPMLAPFERERDWPIVYESASWTPLVIEPGESDTIAYDVVLPPSVAAVSLYSHIENARQTRLRATYPVGWQASRMVVLPAE